MTKTKVRLISAGIAALLLAAALFLILPSALSVSASSEEWSGLLAERIESGDGSENNPYLINTAEELAFMASKVNEGDSSYVSAYYKLEKDILLNETLEGEPNVWTPIGNSSNKFVGTFNGNGKTISGIKIVSDAENQGLFGFAGSGSTITNLGVINSDIKGGEYVGGICGHNFGTIKNCSISAAVKGKNEIGGICGYNGSTITGCTNNGTVTDDGTDSFNAFAGGICGHNAGNISKSQNNGTVGGTGPNKGGISGSSSGNCKITECVNTGAVNGANCVGGICSYAGGTSNAEIENCYNTGTITASGGTVGGICGNGNGGTFKNCYNAGTVNGGGMIGGICGNNPSSSFINCYNTVSISTSGYNAGGVCGENHGSLTGCYNIGDVSGEKDYIGGVSGDNYGSITCCFNTGAVDGYWHVGGVSGKTEGSLTNCYNTGAVNGRQYVGGVIGWCNGTTTTGCYSTAAVYGTSYIGGVCGRNKSETLTYCYYDKNFCTVGGISSTDVEGQATGMTTAELCGSLPTGFDESAWVAGSFTADGKKATATLHKPKEVEGVPAQSFKLYNFGINGKDDWQTYTEIYTAAELQKINENLSGNYVLMNDIDVAQAVTDGEITASENGTNWTAIGTDSNRFTGKFSGDGHTISGIKIVSDADHQGLFGYSSGTIMNVGVINSEITGGSYVGGVCGANNGTINNCSNSAAVKGKGTIGGICGYNDKTVADCTNNGTVTDDGTDSSNAFAGGICGQNFGSISKSQNNGTVGGTGSNKGGIAGCNHGGEKITECINTGAVSGKNYVGGICGNNGSQYTTVNSEISNCYNTGTVNGNSNVGGINGVNYRSVANCYNTGAVSGTSFIGGVNGYNYGSITGCYSTGTVNGSSSIGGVCGGKADSSTVSNCYYDKDFCSAGGIKGADVESQATGMTTAELCGSLPTGFDESAWVAGSYSADSKKIIAVYHQLKVFENVPAQSYKLYNFGTNGTDDWQTYTEIYTAAELQKINENLSGNYVLMNDIDVAQAVTDGEITASENGTNWTPIGSSTASFTGKFSGDGHTISGIKIDTTSDYQGLFGCSSGTIMNVGVINSEITGGRDVGGICGENYYGKIINCYSNCEVSGTENVGGVCGNNYYARMNNCYSTGIVYSTGYVGGVCGYNNNSTITNCYNTGAVNGSGNYSGGVCGMNDNSTIANCYNTGDVTGSRGVGGISGNNNSRIENCYSTGTVGGTNGTGGISGYNNSDTITNCYYDTDFCTAGGIDSADVEGQATGLSTAVLCSSLPTGFEESVWTAGGYTADGKKATATLPQLKAFADKTITLSLYNFGTDEAPDWDTYTEITTAKQLQDINKNLSGNYVLMNDIDVAQAVLSGQITADENGTNWTAIGNATDMFTGKFDGNSHTVSGIVINSTSDYQGLFGRSKGTIMNVGVINSEITGGSYVGGICGWTPYPGIILDCYFRGTVNGTEYVGGVCGRNGGTITNCYNTGAVSGTSNVGGVCGRSIYGTITNCYNTGAVSGDSEVGGVCGNNEYSTIQNCYNTGAVSGTEYVGGVCGYNDGTIQNCYSTGAVSGTSYVGGVCGINWGTITNCYYDTDFCTVGGINGSDEEGKATGLTTAVLCSSLPTGFDSAVWTAGSESDITVTSGRFGKKVYTFPSLNGVGSAASYEEKLYNFGTAESPDWRIYTAITTAKQLQDINKNLSGNYVLMNDIDVSVLTADETGTNWTPIGNATDMFTGKFSGDGHTVSGIKIDSDADYQGLFGCSSGTIMNVGVINSSIETSGNYVGGVCGSNNGTVKDCYNNSTVSGGNDVGGVCGVVQCGTITNCYNTGSVSGTSSCIGGVCGANHDGGKITNCYNTGEVSGTDNVGGVCGYNHYAAMDNCYSTGTVSGTDNVGGVCGGCLWYNIKNCYNAGTVSGTGDVGGVCGSKSDNGTIANCYYLEGTASKSVGNASDSDDAKRISAKELCNSTLPTFLSEDNWTAGSFNATTGDCKLPQLKVFENVSAQTLDLYNFGTAESPDWRIYTEITTAKQLQDINKNLSGNYILMNDIDVSVLTADETGTNWTAIGTRVYDSETDSYTENPFTGIFEGNGHTVSGIVINSTSDYQGLFGYSTGTIMNVGVINSSIKGGNNVGGVCGRNCGTITNCYNTGAVSGTSNVGGVCGRNNTYCEITNCYSAGIVSGTQYVGGVCGYNDQGVFDNCYYNKDSYTGEGLGYYYNALPKDVLGMTTKQFESGEVAYLLNGDQSAMIWKQNIGKDDSPRFVGGTVYRNESYSGCIHQPGTMSYVYNNSDNDPIYAGYYKETVVDPTYTEKGYTLYECTVCGDSYKDNYTDRLILTAVKNLAVVEKTELTVTLGWEKNASADGYIIETANASTWERIITLKNNSTNTYTITGLNQSTSYRFRVTPYVMSGSSVLRGNAAVITAKTATTALTGLVATTATNGTAIRLTWEKNSTAAGYIIDKLVDGNWVRVKTLTSNSSVSYTVSGLDSSTAYRFRVTPYTMLNETVIKGTGISVTGKTAPTALTGLAATAATNGTAIRLTWDKNSTAAGYIIDKLVDGNWVSVKTLTSNSYVSYTVSGLDSSKAYRFRVTPYTTFNGDIIKSAGVSVTGKTTPAAISGLKIGNATANYITLSWDKNTTASGYIVEKLVGSKWESVVTVKSSSATRYTVTGLNASTSYRFRVTPFTTFGDGTIRGTGASVTGKTLKA